MIFQDVSSDETPLSQASDRSDRFIHRSSLALTRRIKRKPSISRSFNTDANTLRQRIPYIQRRVLEATGSRYHQARPRSTTTPRTVDMRSMTIRRRRKFTPSEEKKVNRAFLTPSRTLKTRPNKSRRNFLLGDNEVSSESSKEATVTDVVTSIREVTTEVYGSIQSDNNVRVAPVKPIDSITNDGDEASDAGKDTNTDVNVFPNPLIKPDKSANNNISDPEDLDSTVTEDITPLEPAFEQHEVSKSCNEVSDQNQNQIPSNNPNIENDTLESQDTLKEEYFDEAFDTNIDNEDNFINDSDTILRKSSQDNDGIANVIVDSVADETTVDPFIISDEDLGVN